MRGNRSKYIISLIAIIALILKLTYPRFNIDNTVVILIFIALIPWIQGIFKSIELPSGHKIELQEFNSAAEKIDNINKNHTIDILSDSQLIKSRPSFLSLVDMDVNLALISLRLEIEKRIKSLAATYEISINQQLDIITKELQKKGVFDERTLSGLLEIVKLGNDAAHGSIINFDKKEIIIEKGKAILLKLDILNAQTYKPNTTEGLKIADIILTFEGADIIDMAIQILSYTIKNEHIMLIADSTIKMKTGDILNRLGALVETEENSRGSWTKHKISPFGIALYSYLINK